jgi:dienelactone hydrolase
MPGAADSAGLRPHRADARLTAMGRLRRAWVSAGAVLVLTGAGCGSGPAGAPVRLAAGPAVAALVDPVHVSVSGLPPAGLITVQARALDRQGQPWVSAAVFRASTAGTLNLATAVPVSGSYHTADAAGLLWSLHPASGATPATGFTVSTAGFTVRLDVLTGGRVRASATLQRQLPFSASTLTVRRDGFAGTLYTPAAVKPGAPAVVVLGGAEGGEDAAPALGLAMSGYPALALAYFDEPGLPQCLCSIPLEYFARAIGWLRAQPAGRGRPVVLYGASRGAEAVLLLASYLPHLADGIVASSPTATINPANNVVQGPAWTFGGQPLAPAGNIPNIPVTRIRVPLLMGDGGQDTVWDSAAAASTIMGELRGSPDHAPATNLYYPGAGHYDFGFPPYFPFFTTTDVAGMGGSAQADALATEQFWTRMITFLNHLAVHQPTPS